MNFYLNKVFLIFLFWIFPTSASAQLIPDRTLGNESSRINRINNLRQEINGGATRGSDLFHSFQEFNINSGETVIFNAPGINNIFTRVTGNNISNIFGTLGVNGNSNLFLINPNGFIFGEGARLDLNGSLVVTTAESIQSKNFKFSAINPQGIENYVKINFPLNFGFNQTQASFNSPSEIKIIGSGHNFRNREVQGLIGRPFDKQSLPEGLKRKNQNFVLLGNQIKLDGGIIEQNSGNIKIIGVNSGTINLDKNFTVNTENVIQFGSISFTNRSLLDTSSSTNQNGLNSGSIEVKGQEIKISNNSIFLNENNSLIKSGNIVVNAQDKLEIVGIENEFQLGGFYSEVRGQGEGANIIIDSPNIFLENARMTSNTFGKGNGGNIDISTNNLNLYYNTEIITGTFNTGKGGDINIKSQQNISLLGNGVFVNRSETKSNSISTRSANFGAVGDLNLRGVNLEIKDGSSISSTTLFPRLANIINQQFEPNQALNFTNKPGNITIDLSGKLIVSGSALRGISLVEAGGTNVFAQNPNLSTVYTQSSRISNTTFSSINTGKTNIKANEILLENNGLIGNISFGSGISDQLFIQAKSNITINNSAIISAIQNPFPQVSEIGAIPIPQTTSPSGEININTQQLNMNRGFISTANDSLGKGGQININANIIKGKNISGISAFSNSASGGNIDINSQSIELTEKTEIVASSGGTNTNADAGSIKITTDQFSLSNSKIKADAKGGSGGNITIDTRILKLLNESEISANVGFVDENGVFQGSGNGGNININALSRNGAVAVLDRSAITANATLGRGGNIRIAAVALFTTPGSRIEAISRLGIDGIVEFELSQDSDKLISTIEQPYPNYVKSANEICQPINGDRESMKFGIRDVLPSKDVLSQGAWQYNFFFSEDERAKTQETWGEVLVPNATIKTEDGQMYRALVCVTKIAD